MKSQTAYPLSIATIFIWAGFVGAISFMESWLKFQAPGITLSLGLGIGKLVFGALNIMEWVFAVLILTEFSIKKRQLLQKGNILFLSVLAIVFLQTFWLLPTMSHRANLLIAGQTLGESQLHFYYVGFEIIKLVCLLLFGNKLLKPYRAKETIEHKHKTDLVKNEI